MTQDSTIGTRAKRLDLQGLRILAVGLVIIYHLYPGSLPGGFVGVDIFFVISGYLIVGSLVRELAKTGSIGLGTFYARRIRRLLPASTLVLLGVMVASVVVLPQSRWQEVARDVVASALQVQNWNQAFGSTSYEAAGELVSPVQHFWSLAVEEQFYLLIPLLLLVAAACARLIKRGAESAALWLLLILAAASLIHSIVFSRQSHDFAYLATTTRMWELALGGITALVFSRLRLNSLTQLAAGWIGLAMVLVSAVTVTTTMAFPGYIALVPVLGTVLIIVAGAPGKGVAEFDRFGFSRFLSLRPLTYLGDISYSLYLWHWPVIVFYILLAGQQPGIVAGVGILLLSLVLASLSYHLVEQRFRHGKPATPTGEGNQPPRVQNRSAFALAAGLILLSCLSAAGPWSVVQAKSMQTVSDLATPDYPGALALDTDRNVKVREGVEIIPDPAIAMKDKTRLYRDGCAAYDPAKIDDSMCRYGDPTGTKSLVLIGDSHAGQYLEPLEAMAKTHGWRVRAMVRNGCPFNAAPAASATVTYTNCSSQNAVSLDKILGEKPDRVVISAMTPHGYNESLNWRWESDDVVVDGYEQMIRPLLTAGIKVSVIADNPYPERSIPDCVARNGAQSPECVTVRQQTKDPLLTAAEKLSDVQVIDPTSFFCVGNSCPPVIGNVLVYRDNHLTTTFAETLETLLTKKLALP
ncbi:acyltransferase [Arthrobacter psychrolactophilus]|uniref:Acyltransferase n=1 Tax=Arthrobacter psychrolactophilus TaxID=92442 RepID=A0A2V5ITH8_9MICC|nr:acyltransferase family protein [Arthrobacter psychrolactophilus]PYI39829.1 acyltransferase [Arthrobacter psychrolactophilus]